MAAWADARRTSQPLRTALEPVRLAQPLEQFTSGRTFVKALGDPRGPGRDPFYEAADRYRDHPAWRHREHPSNHMLPLNDPAWVAELLLELA